MNPIERLDYYKNLYTKNESVIYQWIKDNPSQVTKCGIDELTKMIPTSKAAIVRFSKKIGYSGFSEFKFELSKYLISGTRKKDDNLEFDTVRSLTSLYAGYIKQITNFITIDEVKKAAHLIINSRRVKIMGRNRTSLSAQQLRHRLTRIDFDAEAINDPLLLAQIGESLTDEDIVIIFTTRGIDPFYLKFLKDNKNIKTLVISTSKTNILDYPTQAILLPSIANITNFSFLDDQALLFVFIEILLAEMAYILKK